MEDKHQNGRFLQRILPARVVFIILGFFGFCLVYAYKVVVSMTIIAMVLPATTTNSTANSTSHECPAPSSNSSESFPGVKFNWDGQIKSQVLGSFFYGYVITQIPAGIIASKYGGKWVFGTCIFVSALLSLLGPIAAKADYKLFIATRIGQGLAEGVVFPCMSTMIAQWMPTMERTRGNTVIQSGLTIGTVITLPLSAMLSKSHFMGSWEATFYVLGAAGVIWYLLWIVLVFESPEVHPFISSKERSFILQHGGGMKEKENFAIPYKKMFTSVPVYALVLTHFGQNWGFLTVLNLMPTYMNNVQHMSINENMIISAVPYLGQALYSWIASYVSDKARQSGRFKVSTIRKTNAVIAYIPPAICLALVPIARCNSNFASMMLIIAMTLNGSSFSSLMSTHVDMAPSYSGTLMGITNSFGNIPGFLATIVAEQFTKHGQTVENWSYVFYISAGVFVATTLIYCIFGSAEEQSWGRHRKVQQRTTEEAEESKS